MQNNGNAAALNYVDVEEAARLLATAPRTVRKKIEENKLSAMKVKGKQGGGKGGYRHVIPASELPMEAQILLALQREDVGEADLAAYRDRFGQEGLERLLRIRDAVLEVSSLKESITMADMRRREELAQELGVSIRMMYLWEKNYAEGGLAGIMARLERSDKGKPRVLCLLAQDRLNYMYLSPGKVSQNRVHQSLIKLRDGLGTAVCRECCHNPKSPLRAAMLARGEDPGEACGMCGEGLVVPDNRHAVNRYIKGIDPGVVTLARYGKKAFDDLYTPSIRREKPKRINEIWFGDHHIFDVFVLDSQGRAQRPWLTAWMDAASGRIVGWIISFRPNSETIVESLVRGIAGKAESDIWGAPLWIFIDNGKDYRAERVEGFGEMDYQPGQLNLGLPEDHALLKTLGIGYHHALPYHAQSKPIERLFRTIEGMEEIRGLPGYCGNGPEGKPEKYMEDVRKKRLLNLEQFVALWVNRILPNWDSYHNKNEQKESPAAIYQRLPKARTEQFSWGLLSIAMTQKTQRKIRPDGLRVDNIRYWHNAMAEHVGATVTVRYFEKNRELVSIFLNNRLLCTAPVAESFRMLGEDPQKVADWVALQASVRKSKLAVLELPRKRVQILDDMAAQIPDLNTVTNITSIVHEQAYADRRAAEKREGQKAETTRKVSDAIRRQQEEAGRALLAMPDVG